MGIALWLVSGAASFGFARIVPFLRGRAWFAELITAFVTALLLGAVSTALDFGGWREPDWRAALFAFFGALTAVGVVRLTITGKSGGSP